MRKWMTMLLLGGSMAVYLLLARRDPEDDGWGDLGPDWWDL
jgi:hypothetical protein